MRKPENGYTTYETTDKQIATITNDRFYVVVGMKAHHNSPKTGNLNAKRELRNGQKQFLVPKQNTISRNANI